MSDEVQVFEQFAEERHEDEANFDVQLARASGETGKELKARTKHGAREPGDTEGQLTVDVYQTPTEIVVESAVAGVSPEDLDITATRDSITIRGERHREHEIHDDDYFYQECYWGRFSRSVMLPQEVNPEEAAVGFKNGILTIRLPKASTEKSKKLKVRLD